MNKECEDQLLEKNQPQEIVNLIKIILIFLNESYEEVLDENICSFLLNEVLIKYNINSLKGLFTDYFPDKISLTKESIEKVRMLTDDYPLLFNPSDLIKVNKGMSFLTFVLKDIKEYVLKRIETNQQSIIYYEDLRGVVKEMKTLKAKYYLT